MQKIDFFLQETSFFSFLFVLIDQKLQYVFNFSNTKPVVGDIYLASIESKQNNIGVFFVKLNHNTNAMLEINEYNKKLALGSKILVQVKKESMGEKLAVVSQDIVCFGFLANYKPSLLKNNFLKNVDDEQQQEIDAILPKGVIVKNSYNYKLFSALKVELENLKNFYNSLLNKTEVGLIYSYGFLQNIIFKNPNLIPNNIYYTNAISLNEINKLKQDFNFFNPSAKYLMQKEVEFLKEELNNILHDKIIINENVNLQFILSEHFNYIDVNYTGSDSLFNKKEDAVKKANLSSLNDIVQNILLRNLSGQILVDLLKLNNKSYKNNILEHIKRLFKNDSLKTHILGFSNLGLLEISRQKQGESLDFVVKDFKYLCFTLINDIYLKLQQNKSEIKLLCNKDFYHKFTSLAKNDLLEITTKYKLEIKEEVDELYINPKIV